MAAYLGAGVDAAVVGQMATIAVGDQVGVIHPGQWGIPASGGSVYPGAQLYDLIVVDRERGYNLTFDGDLSESFFRAMLATVAFDPASAVDVLPKATP